MQAKKILWYGAVGPAAEEEGLEHRAEARLAAGLREMFGGGDGGSVSALASHTVMKLLRIRP